MNSKAAPAMPCNACAIMVFFPENVSHYTCSKCKLIALLEEKVQQVEARLLNKTRNISLEKSEASCISN